MKKSTITLFLTAFMALVSNAQNGSDAILGKWSNEAKDANFEIYKEGGKYFGKIISGSGDETKDVNNPNTNLRDREIIGLVMLQDFVFDGKSAWVDGSIYDPREGKTYSCKITPKSKNQINVRGYVGIPMFGRTEIWTKINK